MNDSTLSARNLRDTTATPWLLAPHDSKTASVVLSPCCKEGSIAVKLRYAKVQIQRRSAPITWHGSEVPKL